MDGGSDIPHPVSSAGRPEPCAMFFVVFGLVYEALANSAVESTTSALTRQPITIAALQSLKYLTKPEFSGQSLQETTIFDEFINLCYRMVMTEAASIQVHLIEAMVTLATTQVYSGYQ
jgi:HEAT repeat-containing protein 5